MPHTGHKITPGTMELSEDFKSCLRHFVFYYTNGTLPYVLNEPEILAGIDYRERLKTEASLVEMVFSIYVNNLKMDTDGTVLNDSHAMKRAAQYIRWMAGDDHYTVEPPFEEWETYLY